MRVNVYEHEVTLDIKLVTKDERDALGKFVRHMYGLRFAIGGNQIDPETGNEIPRSAITFWSSERTLAGDFADKLALLQEGIDGR